MRNEKITYEDQYQGHPIMTDKARQLGCKESILQKIDQLMTDMSNRHSKVPLAKEKMLQYSNNIPNQKEV